VCGHRTRPKEAQKEEIKENDMPKKKSKSNSTLGRGNAERSQAGAALESAIQQGDNQAVTVFANRMRKQRRRTQIVKRKAAVAREREDLEATMPESAVARRSTGTLLAEGDSWFDYPLYDVLKNLDDDYGYDVHSVAHRGDALEIMAYGQGQLDDFARTLERVLRSGTVPKAVLLSGGGNDVAGDVFSMILNHKLSPLPGINAGILEGVLQQRIRLAYATILSAVTQLCRRYLDRPVPVLVHGYAYPVPDGRGFLGGWGPLPGPWFQPGFREKGYEDLQERADIAMQLINAFNGMLQQLVAQAEFAHVHYIDLRPELSNKLSDYKRWWGNELHPTDRGFDAVTKRFADTLASLP
jgi:lysophospholipase L1-like esterase